MSQESPNTHLVSSLSAGLAGVSEAEGVGVFEEADSSSCVTLPPPPLGLLPEPRCLSFTNLRNGCANGGRAAGSSDSSNSDAAVVTRR